MLTIPKIDIDNIIEEDETAKIHEEAEVFEPKTEEFFKVSVFTAICDSFNMVQ